MQQFQIDNFENSVSQLEKIINTNKQKLENLLSLPNKTYDNFIIPYQLLNETLEEFITPVFHLDSVENSDLTQQIYSQCLPILSAYSTQLGQNEQLFQAIKDIKNSYSHQLNQQQNKVLDNEIRDFILSGCGKTKDEKQQLEDINLQLSELSKDFSQNLLDATNAWEMICNKEDVQELPKSDKQSAEFIDPNGETKYKFTLQMPSYISYITYGNNRKKREEIYKAYSTRASENEDIIEQILHLKHKKANILGFENYAEYSLATKMAKTQQDVLEFLDQLATASKQKAIKELQEVEQLALKLDNLKKLESFDLAYYSEKLKKEQYDIDQEYYKPYFEQDSVVNGLFEFLNQFFNIQFTKIDEKAWNDKVKVFHISQNNQFIGKIFLDLEARETKRGGAWMHNWHTKYNLPTQKQTPSAFIICNFQPSTTKQKSLLRHSDVITLFHEMGHALHHLLTTVDQPFVSGINGVAWDTVEFPSQFLEYFAYEKEVLKIFAKHYQTKKVLDDDAIDKLIKAKNFQTALATIRQVEFAIFDFKLYQKPRNKQEVQDLLNQIRQKYAVIIPPEYNKFQNGFSHIFAGGYSAGYYSYKWAEVLSADAFYLFKEKGIFNKSLATKYKELILGKGGSEDMNKLYFQFASREPSVESLLKIDNIIS